MKLIVFCHPNTEGIIFKIRVTRHTCTRDPEYIIYSPFVAEIIFTEVSRQFHALFPAPQNVGLISEYGLVWTLHCIFIHLDNRKNGVAIKEL